MGASGHTELRNALALKPKPKRSNEDSADVSHHSLSHTIGGVCVYIYLYIYIHKLSICMCMAYFRVCIYIDVDIHL